MFFIIVGLLALICFAVSEMAEVRNRSIFRLTKTDAKR
jgi:hypothetical protein